MFGSLKPRYVKRITSSFDVINRLASPRTCVLRHRLLCTERAVNGGLKEDDELSDSVALNHVLINYLLVLALKLITAQLHMSNQIHLAAFIC